MTLAAREVPAQMQPRTPTELVRALLADGLVDEVRLFVFPVVVGHGDRLFVEQLGALRLLETRSFVSGAVLLRYATSSVR